MPDPLAPGGVIGILGGGQLGRMLVLAAARLGYRAAVLSPDPESPAFQVADRRFATAYDDAAALAGFAEVADVITYEFENVPSESLDRLAECRPVRPHPRALATTQDRLFEKDFLSVLEIPAAASQGVASAQDLAEAVRLLGAPVIVKTRQLGYDGKGQVRLASPEEAGSAWERLGGRPAIAEAVVPFDREISVLLARGVDGRLAVWPASENLHEEGILRRTTVPADISPDIAATARDYAERIAEALDFVGVLAVEMFVIDRTGEVIVNEIAPRVHNSGHWTLDGAVTSQFEQHVRAICGLPLGDTAALGQVRMDNLIGSEIGRWAEILADPAAHLHHYGKREPRPGRKMGHVTWVRPEEPPTFRPKGRRPG